MTGCEGGACKPPGKVKGGAGSDAGQQLKSDSVRLPEIESPYAIEERGVPIEIEVISDTMCPWCWVGKRNMELALRDCSPSLVRVSKLTWRPYFLDVDLPDGGKPVRDYYRDNYGDPSAGENMQPHLVAAGRKAGLDFETTYGKLTHYRPTIQSHRLIELARRQGRQNEAVEEVFKMYFEGGGHLNCIDDLIGAAERAGVTGAREFLEGDDCREEVLAEAKRARGTARGVPTFVFRRADRPKGDSEATLMFSGGRPPRAFAEAFQQLCEMD